jgi:hypothetical protein
MAFKMNYNRDSFPYKTDERVKDDLINIRKNERPTEQGKGPTKKENMGYPKYGKKHDGPSFNAQLRKEAMDPDTTMNEDFKEKVLSSNTKNKYSSHMPKHVAGHENGDDNKKTKPGGKLVSKVTKKLKTGLHEVPTSKKIINKENQGDFVPAWPGADISEKKWKSMTKEEQKAYTEKHGD